MRETWAMVDRLQDVERLQTLSVNNRQHSETITTITLIQLHQSSPGNIKTSVVTVSETNT